MALKKIQYDVELLSTETALQGKTPIVYTNDLNSAEFVFNILDMTPEQLAGATATTLLYMRDGSFFQNSDVNLDGNTLTYLLKENEGNHSGLAKIQLVVKIGTAEYASQLYSFEVVNGLETKVAVEVMIQDWTALTRDAQAYIEQFNLDEATRKQQFDDAQTARTNIFTQSETERQETESKRIEDEALRQAGYDADHVRAASDHIVAETDHTTAVADHTEIINARGSQQSLDARLDGLDAKDTDLQSQINTNKTDIAATYSRIDNLNNKMDRSFDIILDKIISLVSPAEFPGVEITVGHYDQGRSPLVENSLYTTYSFIPDEDIVFYFEQLTNNYMSVTVYKDDTMSTVLTPRMRHLGYSTDFTTIPTVSNPLLIKQGSYVNVTINTNSTLKMIYTDYSKIAIRLSDSVKLNAFQIEQTKREIINSIAKKCYFKYNASPQSVDVFIPAKVGFSKYLFVHTLNASINSDKWRIDSATAVSDDFSQRYVLTTSGEWEMAITLSGRPDFIGGKAHGDEKQTSFYALVDGNFVDITTTNTLTEFENLTFIGTSNMFDPNDNVTKVGEHGTEHTFTEKGLRIKQSVKWLWTGEIGNSYLAMFPIAKTASDKFYTNKTMALVDITGPTGESGITEVTIIKSDKGLTSKFGIGVFPNLDIFMMTDNGGGLYNKCYYKIKPGTVTSGEIWKSETYYSFEIGK